MIPFAWFFSTSRGPLTLSPLNDYLWKPQPRSLIVGTLDTSRHRTPSPPPPLTKLGKTASVARKCVITNCIQLCEVGRGRFPWDAPTVLTRVPGIKVSGAIRDFLSSRKVTYRRKLINTSYCNSTICSTRKKGASTWQMNFGPSKCYKMSIWFALISVDL